MEKAMVEPEKMIDAHINTFHLLQSYKRPEDTKEAIIHFNRLLTHHLKQADGIYYEHQTTLGEKPELNAELRLRIDETIRRLGEILFDERERIS